MELTDSSNNTVSGNDAKANGDGIYLGASSNNNIVSCNNATANGDGICLNTSNNNEIYHNNFVNNKLQVVSSNSMNVWNDGYPSGGNYWSDYNGTDLYSGPYQNVTGSDGIGDTPYVIDANNTDNYPLMNLYRSTSLFFARTIVGQNTTMTTTITLVNYGTYPRALNVTLYVNTTVIGTQTVNYVSNGTPIILEFAWNTTGFAYGNYTLSASIQPVNNNCTGGAVTVTIPGDVNGEGKVNMGDVVAILKAFGSTPGMPNYNANCDIDGNGKVDMGDVVIALRNFGQHYP
jgi:parallel beta-helix repeat protein